MYGNIGYTRRDKYKDRILNRKQKENLIKLERELHNRQNECTLLYESDISDEELHNEVIPIQNRIDLLIEQISNIKYVRNR